MSGGHKGRGRLRRTKIVCTIGPASSSTAMIERLMRAGMDCARLNFSHGTFAEHLSVIRNVRDVSKHTGSLVAVMQDLPGPKMRVGRIKGGSIKIAEGSTVILATKDGAAGENVVPVESENLPRYVKAGGTIFLRDGLITLRVVSTTETSIKCVCEVGGVLLSGHGVNVPDLKQGFDTFTEKDKRYLAFGLEQGVDLVAVSFVRDANDIKEVREFVEKKAKGEPMLVAKIEKREAVENLAEIVNTTDAVMVARGDLGVENPIEGVPEMQKSIIATCRSRGVPVITATQMLESMVSRATPTRAEVTDVANAILDGTDAVMLSEETATGAYPVECVEVMNKVALKAEERMLEDQNVRSLSGVRLQGLVDAFSESAWQLAENIGANVIAVRSGNEAIIPKVSRFRPRAMIVHMTDEEVFLRRSRIVWGVFQSLTKHSESTAVSLDSSVRRLMREGYLRRGERAVFVRGTNGSAKDARFSLSVLVADGSERVAKGDKR
jgi:pyruvate kinase